MGSITNTPTGKSSVNGEPTSMTHDQRVGYIIESLLDTEWLFIHKRQHFLAGYGHDSKLAEGECIHITNNYTNDPIQQTFDCVCGMTRTYVAGENHHWSLDQLDDPFIKDIKYCMCLGCIEWVKENYYLMGEKIKEVEYVVRYDPSIDPRRKSR
jgi:hypothetical protein